MSEPATPARPFYVTGGTLKPGEPSYVERRADTDLFESILAGEFCYVLTARQMGKSSLMARTATQLEQAGVASAIVDLTQIGGERGAQAAAQWYFGIANEIHRRLKIAEPLRPWWQERSDLPSAQRLVGFFRELVLTHCSGRVVIFVDEIDSTIGLPFADDFFAALRACFNARATETAFERLTFVLLGVATPDQLIRDSTRTPFNIGKRIDLTDFSPDEARTLAPGLHADQDEADRRLERILYWTGGHPYLSQALCRAVLERAVDAGTTEKAVDPQAEELFLTSRAQREETNLKYARARLEKPGPEGRRLLQLYRRVREGKPVPDQPTSPFFAQLKLAGVVKVTDEGRLAVRNRVYELVFTPEWVKSEAASGRFRQHAALWGSTVAAALISLLLSHAYYNVQILKATNDYPVALAASRHLTFNPFGRYKSAELLAEYWDRRAVREASRGHRDESILSWLQALRLNDTLRRRREAQALVSTDDSRLLRVFRHKADVAAAKFSPDGRLVVVGDRDGNVWIWKTETGRPVQRLTQHEAAIETVSLTPDGDTVLSCDKKGIVRVTAVKTGTPMRQFTVPMSQTTSVAFSPDGRSLLTGDFYGVAQLWSVNSGKPLGKSFQHGDQLFSVGFSPDGKKMLTGGFHNDARLWEAGTVKSFGVPSRKSPVFDVAISPDGKTLLKGDFNDDAELWDTSSMKPIGRPLWQLGSFYAVAFSPDGKIALTGSEDGSARFWDAASGRPIGRPLWHQGSIYSAMFSQDGNSILTASGDGTARLWQAGAGEAPRPSIPVGTDVHLATFSPDGRTVAIAGWDNTVRFWETGSGKSVGKPLQHPELIRSVAFSPDGRSVVTTAWDHKARVWDLAVRESKELPLERSIYFATFTPAGAILTASSDNVIRLWNRNLLKVTAEISNPSQLKSVAFSADGGVGVIGSGDEAAQYQFHASEVIKVRSVRLQSSVEIVALSPDGRTLLTKDLENRVQLWRDNRSFTLVPSSEKREEVLNMAFRGDGKKFLLASAKWLMTYDLDAEGPQLRSSHFLEGSGLIFRFPPDCTECLQAGIMDSYENLRFETFPLGEPAGNPIEGTAGELLAKWQERLGLRFDSEMNIVPRWPLPDASR